MRGAAEACLGILMQRSDGVMLMHEYAARHCPARWVSHRDSRAVFDVRRLVSGCGVLG